jgi:hypothetical protein
MLLLILTSTLVLAFTVLLPKLFLSFYHGGTTLHASV